MRWFAVVTFIASAGVVLAQCMPMPDQAPIVALPADSLIEGVGSCDLPITTRDELAGQLVRQGFALAHCFWFNESVRSFRDAARRDPDCPAAWAGLNFILTMPWFTRQDTQAEAEHALKRAIATAEKGSDVEQQLTQALGLRKRRVDDRKTGFANAMRELVARHPTLAEPRLILAGLTIQWGLWDGYDEKGEPAGAMTDVIELVKPVLRRDPMNAGAHHYVIHAYEGSEPSKALASALALVKAAPGSSHMVHMPGHIHNRLGDFAAAQQVFTRSREIDEEYAKKIPGGGPNANWNYGHNLAFMAYNLAEAGRLEEADALRNKLPWVGGLIDLRAGRWEQLAKTSSKNLEGWFERGMAAVAGRDRAAARTALGEVVALRRKTPAEDRTTIRIQDTMVDELAGALAFLEGDQALGERALRRACRTFERIAYEEPPYYPRPPHETLGNALLAAGRFRDAEDAFREVLRLRPNSWWGREGLRKAKARG